MTETIVAACLGCSREFTPKTVEVLGKELFRQKYCAECTEAAERESREKWEKSHAAHLQARAALWEVICPNEYRTISEGGRTDMDRLAKDCRRLPEVVAWPGGKGMIFHGPTGAGKTRAMWRLVRKMFDRGWTVAAMTSGEFGRGFADACGTHTRKAWFDRLTCNEVFFLDDLGKSKWTPAVWGEFFEVIEARGRAQRVTLITSNDAGETLASKAQDPELWAALYRRLKEYTDVAP